MTNLRLILFPAAVLAALAACTSPSGDPGGPQPDAGGGNGVSVKLSSNARLGTLLSDSDGKTLYYFAKDLPGAGAATAVSNCSGACITKWPAFHASSLNVGDGLSAADFGEITRGDGSKQTTYHGWPLYYFSSDATAGDVNGDDSGHVWFVLRDPFYSVMFMSSGASTGPKQYLSDPAGRTLYYFAKDTTGSSATAPVSACTSDQCLATWPVFAATGSVTPTGIDAITTFTRADGKTQSMWRGHPLYYFASDAAPGETKGDQVGGVWFAADPQQIAAPVAVDIGNSPTLGDHLIDDAGRTLYYFGKDLPTTPAAPGASSCAGGCAAAWPPFLATSATVGAGLDSAAFGEITRADGSKQTTYRGWPLYRYAADVAAGATTGDGSGKVWFVARAPFYTAVLMSNTPALYMGDAGGRTLYYFAKDTVGTASKAPVSACTDACLAAWPAFTVDSSVLPSSLGAQIKTFTRPDGVTQAAWKGHPLYYYGADTAPGEHKGQNLGNVWFVVEPTAL